MKKILITGSNGFIGQEIMHEALTNSDAELTALSRGDNRFSHKGNYRYICADVCNAEHMEEVISEFHPDCVIHTVALANVDVCEKEPELCEMINVQSVKILVALAEKYSFQLIYLSTDFIFDGENGPYKEDDDPNPLNKYGKSKLQAERLIQESNCRWSIVRTILVYGAPREAGRSNFILWVKNSLQANKIINVVTDHVRMPTYVNDVARACLQIATQGATGIFHISSEELFSVYEIAQQVADFWNLDKSLIQPVLAESLSSSVPRPHYTGFIIEKAKTDLDFSPRNLKAGLKEINRSLFS